jgi:hypothetical protein
MLVLLEAVMNVNPLSGVVELLPFTTANARNMSGFETDL